MSTQNGSPNSEVSEKATRRRFTAEFKQHVLEEYDSLSRGERGAFLRREGLYSSHIDTWRRARDSGGLGALAAKKRGRPPKERNPLAKENAQLRRELARAQRKLKQAETIIEIQKKVALALKELDEEPSDEGENES